jgi:hypothetical protein
MHDSTLAALQNFLTTEFQITSAGSELDLHRNLSARINDLIQKDFPGLIDVLYRLDVDELKLKQALQNAPNEDAAPIIAKLIIDRQLEKFQVRTRFTKNADSESGETW